MATKAKRKRADGEISCEAESNGRRITLEPLQILTLAIPMREVESTLPCGFRQSWVSGDSGKKKFSLTSGAGCGSRWMTFDYAGRQFCVDIEDVVKQAIEVIDATPAKATGK